MIILFVVFFTFTFCSSEFSIIEQGKKGVSFSISARKYSHISEYGKGVNFRFNSKTLNLYIRRSYNEAGYYSNSYSLGHIHNWRNNFFEFSLSYSKNKTDYLYGPNRYYWLGYAYKFPPSKSKDLEVHFLLYYLYIDTNITKAKYLYTGFNFIYNITRNLTFEPSVWLSKRTEKYYGIGTAMSVSFRYSFIIN